MMMMMIGLNPWGMTYGSSIIMWGMTYGSSVIMWGMTYGLMAHQVISHQPS